MDTVDILEMAATHIDEVRAKYIDVPEGGPKSLEEITGADLRELVTWACEPFNRIVVNCQAVVDAVNQLEETNLPSDTAIAQSTISYFFAIGWLAHRIQAERGELPDNQTDLSESEVPEDSWGNVFGVIDSVAEVMAAYTSMVAEGVGNLGKLFPPEATAITIKAVKSSVWDEARNNEPPPGVDHWPDDMLITVAMGRMFYLGMLLKEKK